MLTFILNVLGEVLGIGNLYCMPFIRSEVDRVRDQDRSLARPNVVLRNFGRPIPPLLVEQTPTALLFDGHRDSFETALNRSST